MPTSEFPLFTTQEQQWLLDNYPREVLKEKSYEELLSLLPDPERSYGHVMASAVIELLSMSIINADSDGDKLVGIYGSIRLVDGEGTTFDLYDRKHDNPEIILFGGFLSVTFPMDCAITLTRLAKLHIDLKDSYENGAEIVKGVFVWDCSIRDCHTEVRSTKSFGGEGSSLVVDFILYRHAVVCYVDVRLLKDFNGINIYGEVVARCAGKFSTVLFERKLDDPFKFNSKTNIQLSRHVVIAPAFSPSLNIHINLFNGDNHEKIVEDTIQFGIWTTTQFLTFDGVSGLTEAEVQWNHPAMQHHFLHEVLPEVINKNTMFPYGPKLIEIYSVSIFGNRSGDMDIWGSIDLWIPGRDAIILFKEEKSSPRKLLPAQMVPLLSTTNSLLCTAFTVSLDLRDVTDRSISMGHLGWAELDCAKYSDLLDRQLCSVVRSVNGCYAAIHYSLFYGGAQAIVKIYVNDKDLDMKYFKVAGTVCAEYSGYDYSTEYRKEYFRKKLFVGGESSDHLLPYPFFSVLLSESSVVVPKGCALMLDVHLNVTSFSKLPNLGVGGSMLQSEESFVEVVEFEPDDVNPDSNKYLHKKVEGSSQNLLIQVEWRYVCW